MRYQRPRLRASQLNPTPTPILGYDVRGTPIVAAVHVGVQLIVWCQYCQRFHLHGHAGAFGGADGQRIPHCDDATPFKRTEYILREVTRPYPPYEPLLRDRRIRR